jgi:hypothetical protein
MNYGADEIGVDGNDWSDDMQRNISTVEGESTDNDVDGKDSSDDDFSTSDNDPDGDDADGSVDDSPPCSALKSAQKRFPSCCRGPPAAKHLGL